jgi:hypothetical protein
MATNNIKTGQTVLIKNINQKGVVLSKIDDTHSLVMLQDGTIIEVINEVIKTLNILQRIIKLISNMFKRSRNV